MSETLRKPLMLLVLLNVGFVHLTSAVSSMWILPLYILTLASPFLARYQGGEIYRLCWNIAILCIFGSLAINAQKAGVMHLLEDGLLLAALCQVHLLNNLGNRQRPDLLFFNSFLIAFVTSFFSQDFGFSILFVLYVATLVPALQLFCATRHQTDRALPRPALRAILWNSVPRTTVAVGLTIAVFLVWPRDFDRDGWVNTESQLSHAMRMAMGLSDTVDPERNGIMGAGEGVMLRIRVTKGDPTELPSHWRGSSFAHYGRRGWRDALGSEVEGFDRPWRRSGPTLSREGTPDLVAEVVLEQGASAWLLAPAEACRVRVAPPANPDFVTSRPDGNLRYEAWFDPNSGTNMTYKVGIAAAASTPQILSTRQRRQWLALDRRNLHSRIPELSAELVAELAPDAGAAAKAHHFAQHFHRNWEYALPGEPGAATSIEHFLNGAPGHCEYFATAVTLMLRDARVPARLVSGVLVDEWDAERREFIAREKHAHAWVEAWDDQAGWITIDPTPSSEAEAAATEAPGFWSALQAPFVELWRDIASFNTDSYDTVMAWLASLPARTGRWIWNHPWWSVLGLLIVAASVRRWLQARRLPPVIADYKTASKRLGIAPQPGETPRELLRRARTLDAPPDAVETLAAAVQAHELAHYATARERATT